MDITKSTKSDVTILELKGRCEIQDFDLLSKHLTDIIELGEKRLILDFSSLHFINSAGLRAIIVAVQKMNNASGKVVFCNVNETVEKLFGITGYSSLLERYSSVEEALKGIKG
ncbi:MAG: STAS domain-containing protein [Ignavibacteria bacterium]|mgnify:CR=1 FL=1|nr:STAS domain-containing protein [Ignavibacteria bacterium]